MPEGADDPLIRVNRWALYKEIERRTIWTSREFEQIVGWSFSMGDAPVSKRALAWALMNLPKSDQRIVQRVRDVFPGMWIGGINDLAGVLALGRTA